MIRRGIKSSVNRRTFFVLGGKNMEKWYIEKVEKILKEVERVFIEESPHLYCLKTLFEIMWYDNQGSTKNERRIKRSG